MLHACLPDRVLYPHRPSIFQVPTLLSAPQLFVFPFSQHVLAPFPTLWGPLPPGTFVLPVPRARRKPTNTRLRSLRLIRLDGPRVIVEICALPARFHACSLSRHTQNAAPATAFITQLLSNRRLPSPHPKRGCLHLPSYNRSSAARIPE